jgi:ABC-type phosphate/phosphonate transport system substrate-binding protein
LPGKTDAYSNGRRHDELYRKTKVMSAIATAAPAAPGPGDKFIVWEQLTEPQRQEIRKRLMKMASTPDEYLWTFDASEDRWRCIPRKAAK